jgi:hypothetical protein
MRRHTTNGEEATGAAPDPGRPSTGVVEGNLPPGGTDVAEGYIEDGDLFGISAEFETAEQLLEAAQAAYNAGYRRMDAYTPLPVEGLSHALGHRDYYVPTIMLVCGTLGALCGFAFIVYCTMISYPMNIGGRPLWSWPSWIPITFECTVIGTAYSGVFGMFLLNGLPEPYHPMFEAPGFERASSSAFFLGIQADDREFDRAKTRAFLESLDGFNVADVRLRKN